MVGTVQEDYLRDADCGASSHGDAVNEAERKGEWSRERWRVYGERKSLLHVQFADLAASLKNRRCSRGRYQRPQRRGGHPSGRRGYRSI